MVPEDPLDQAQVGIARVADIASLLGVEQKRPICGRLGAELLLVTEYLNTAGLDQEERLRVRISKLLRDVERICSWHRHAYEKDYPLLRDIAQASPGSARYVKAQTEIKRGLFSITSKPADAEKFILHIQRFTKRDNSKRDGMGHEIQTTESMAAEYPSNVNVLTYNALQEHMICSCNNGPAQDVCGEHLAQLLLRPPPAPADHGDVQFDMLFSVPSRNGPGIGRWQDVQVCVPRKRKGKNRARFAGHDEVTVSHAPTQLERVDRGQFCKLINLEAKSRVCLTIQDGKLHRSGFDHLKQIVESAPGISLANILRRYRLTAKMKVALAYILSQSVWQYYDSDWMRRRWTSETIQFMKEYGQERNEKRGKLFAWKPYLSVCFGDEDPQASESSLLDGEIHRYPRVRALGIMLVEIGIGMPLLAADQTHTGQPQASDINEGLLLAMRYAKDEKLWRDCDYPNYLSAVNECLDPDIFSAAPYIRGVEEKARLESLKQRRNIMYDKVVFPLEELLQATKWMDQVTSIGPLDTPVETTPLVSFAEQPSSIKDSASGVTAPQQTSRKAAKANTEGKKEARRWLSRMRRLNDELAMSQITPAASSAPVRIVVLDTGCDDNAPFFFHPDNEPRLKGWKDWVDGSTQWQDTHGHGTHLVSLIMQIAPDAHVYVARVSKSPGELLQASENVAQAISWACTECGADVVTMSFGYVEEQRVISRAIRRALYERDDSVLFFAAASNSGANEKEMFPARHDAVISIRCTNSNGDFEAFNAPKNQDEETVFGTLGMDVPSSWLSDHHETEEYKSGTSVATAVAAGLAGVLLGYADARSKESTSYDVRRKLRTRQGMQRMFRALAFPTLKERYLYMAPWKLMGQSDEVRWATFVAALGDIS